MRKIPYKKKQTKASTQYNETLSTDLKYILSESKRIVEVATECERMGVTEGKRLYDRNPSLSKQSTGKMNSVKSMCEGIIDNFNNSQYDLSDPQIKSLEVAFKVASEIIEDFEEVSFELVHSLPKIKNSTVFDTSLLDSVGSTLSDLFEIETVTFRKK